MKIDKIRLHKAIRKFENGTRKEAGRMKNHFSSQVDRNKSPFKGFDAVTGL